MMEVLQRLLTWRAAAKRAVASVLSRRQGLLATLFTIAAMPANLAAACQRVMAAEAAVVMGVDVWEAAGCRLTCWARSSWNDRPGVPVQDSNAKLWPKSECLSLTGRES